MTTSLSLSPATGREKNRHEVKRRTRVKVDVDDKKVKVKLGREIKMEESIVVSVFVVILVDFGIQVHSVSHFNN